MTVSTTLEAIDAWFKTQLMLTPEVEDLFIQPCSVSTFRRALEISFKSQSQISNPLILSCFESKIAAFSPPTLHDVNDPMRQIAIEHTRHMVGMFKDLVGTAIKHHVYHARLFLNHIDMVLETSVEVTVLSADRNHLTLLAWYQGKRSLVPTTHTYDLDRLRCQENLHVPKTKPSEAEDEVNPYEEMKAGLVKLLQTKFPNRRTLPHISLLAFCARILGYTQPARERELTTVFEDETFKVDYPTKGVSIHFSLLDWLDPSYTGNYDTLKSYQDLDEALIQKGKQDNDKVWHFLRLPTRFNDKPSKRALAYEVKSDTAVFYHRMGSHYLAIELHY